MRFRLRNSWAHVHRPEQERFAESSVRPRSKRRRRLTAKRSRLWRVDAQQAETIVANVDQYSRPMFVPMRPSIGGKVDIGAQRPSAPRPRARVDALDETDSRYWPTITEWRLRTDVGWPTR